MLLRLVRRRPAANIVWSLADDNIVWSLLAGDNIVWSLEAIEPTLWTRAPARRSKSVALKPRVAAATRKR